MILAVYYLSMPEILAQYGSQLGGKIVVDISNPLNATYDDLATPPGSSAAGQVAGQSLDVFMAGDDQQAKNRLAEAFRASGLRPIDVGPLSRARHLESVGFLHILLQGSLGTQWASTVKIMS